MVPSVSPRFGAVVLYTPTPKRVSKDHSVSCFLSDALPLGSVYLNDKQIAQNQPQVLALEAKMRSVDQALQTALSQGGEKTGSSLEGRGAILEAFRQKLERAVLRALPAVLEDNQIKKFLTKLNQNALRAALRNPDEKFVDVSDVPQGSASTLFRTTEYPKALPLKPSSVMLTQAARHLGSPYRSDWVKSMSGFVLRMGQPENPVYEPSTEMRREVSKTLRSPRASNLAKSLAGSILRLVKHSPALVLEAPSTPSEKNLKGETNETPDAALGRLKALEQMKQMPSPSNPGDQEGLNPSDSQGSDDEAYRLDVLKHANEIGSIVEPPVTVPKTLNSKEAYAEFYRLDVVRHAQRVGKLVEPPVTVPETLNSKEAYAEFYRLDVIRHAQRVGKLVVPPETVSNTLNAKEAYAEFYRLEMKRMKQQS
ncbi:MAG: hypothetical protein K2X66_00465 [Cyanobacteria bacterium]|nr:hypothetical protein [Cyanobacteriota bacterium]